MVKLVIISEECGSILVKEDGKTHITTKSKGDFFFDIHITREPH